MKFKRTLDMHEQDKRVARVCTEVVLFTGTLRMDVVWRQVVGRIDGAIAS